MVSLPYGKSDLRLNAVSSPIAVNSDFCSKGQISMFQSENQIHRTLFQAIILLLVE
jgi:hypothetical protein